MYKENNVSLRQILILFSIIVFLPSLIFVFFDQTSYSTGILTASIFVILLGYKINIKHDYKSLKNILIYFSLFVLIILIHTYFAYINSTKVDLQRNFGSIIILLIMIIAIFFWFQ